MNLHRTSQLVCLAAALFASLAGCPNQEASDDANKFSPVLLVGTARLDPPAVDTTYNVYRPGFWFPADPAGPQGSRVTGLLVTVAVEDPAAVQMRLLDLSTRVAVTLERTAPPASGAALALAAEPRPYNDTVNNLIAAGRGCFWLDQAGGGTSGLEHSFAVLIPEALLSAFSRLDIYVSVASDGSPAGAARIELVRDFFYLAVIGDSVLWGNGLEEADKMSSVVSDTIERETQRKVILQRYAQSGATIVPTADDGVCTGTCLGEAPRVPTSITTQVGLLEHPELLDLILMDGCINDVGHTTIIDPDTTEEDLVALTEQFCFDEMLILLRSVRDLAPQATIIVTGYYQIVGPDSDLLSLKAWTQTQGLATLEGGSVIFAELVQQSVLFDDTARQSLQDAVDLANQSGDAPARIAFADPGFQPENAIFAPDRWLWSLTSNSQLLEDLNLGLDLFPEDPLQGVRVEACLAPDVLDTAIACIYASVGHPNVAGAQAYADAVILRLREQGVLPAAEP